jgi:zinc transporter ZupT
MVDLALALGAGIAATFLPLVAGIILPSMISTLRGRRVNVWMVAAAAGIMFWFFIDVMNDAAQLDIIAGFGNGLGDYTHAVLALMFAVGIGLLFGIERWLSRSEPIPRTSLQTNATTAGFETRMIFAIAAVAALGIGFHAFGEGMDIGSTLPKATSILDAIGGYYPAIAYVLHKFLEGFVVGIFATMTGASSGRKIGSLVALSGVPTILGFLVGIPSILDSSYFFALGGAGTVYIELKLLPIISRAAKPYALVVPFLFGFYGMYFAGLFHN